MKIQKLIIEKAKFDTNFKLIISGNVYIFDSKSAMKEFLTDLTEDKKHNQ